MTTTNASATTCAALARRLDGVLAAYFLGRLPTGLEAVPWARHCVVCQELQEKGLL